MDLTAFIPEAWKTIARAVAEAGVDANLHRAPAKISKTVKRHCMAELKRLTLILRRLIFLMALSMNLAPVKPRAASNYFEAKESAPQTDTVSFQLTPASPGECPHFLRGPLMLPQPGFVDAAPVLARWTALLHVLKTHQRRAKSLARTLARWQAAGEAKPVILPMAKVHRLSPQLGLIASALPMLIAQALKTWPDTG
jgi:hypothetical protein